MGAMIDIFIVLTIITTIVVAVRQGFVKTILGTFAFVIALGIAMLLCSPLSGAMQKGAIGEKMEGVVHSTIDNIVTEENYDKLFGADEAEGENAELTEDESLLRDLFDIFGAEEKYDEIESGYKGWVSDGLENARDYLKENVTETGVRVCCNVISFLILFIIARILLKVAEVVLDKVVELPVLKQANAVLGVVAGVLLAVFRVFLVCVIIKFITIVVNGAGLTFVGGMHPTDSYLYSFFSNINIIDIIF